MSIRSPIIAATTLGLLLGSSAGVVAQDEQPDVSPVAYSTGIAGDVPETVDPAQRRTADGQLQIRGLQLLDIPVTFTDPRLSGLLTISSNGAGRDFADGFARLEPRTYRIDNDEGSWTGSGERILAVTVRAPRPLINHESMVLFGEGAYDGLVAYVFIELANAAPELEAVVMQIEMAPLPEPIPAKERPAVIVPRRPTTDALAQAAAKPVGTHRDQRS
jgi:hypothetical protein